MDDFTHDLEVMREAIDDAMDGIEATLIVQAETLDHVDGRSRENMVAIRAILRRFERQVTGLESRLEALEQRY